MSIPSWPYSNGDLIFVKPKPDDRIGQFVARATDGPFCHVRIALSGYSSMEAVTARGVDWYYGAFNPQYEEVVGTGANLLEVYRGHASQWLMRQKGRPYSWWDIAADGLKLFIPQWMGSRAPFLIAPSQYDCSSLATLFLLFAGYQWLPDEIAVNPTQVSPNDLARAVGLLK